MPLSTLVEMRVVGGGECKRVAQGRFGSFPVLEPPAHRPRNWTHNLTVLGRVSGMFRRTAKMVGEEDAIHTGLTRPFIMMGKEQQSIRSVVVQ